MAKIFPFKGWRYNQEKVGDISKVVTPPYDVISKPAQQHYYESSPYNIIRLILGQEHPGDNEQNNTYTRAHDFFQKWQKEGILVKDTDFSVYVYEQEFKHKNKNKVRCGFISLLELSDFKAKQIYPHEKTFAAPKLDRLKLLETCRANFSPIFGLYYDKEAALNQLLAAAKMASNQIINIVTEDKIAHRVWQLKDKALIHKILDKLTDKQIFIADGHHRYEAALNFRNQMREHKTTPYTGAGSYNYVMVYLTNLDEEGITILPTHRLLKTLPQESFMSLKQVIEDSFVIKAVRNKEEMLAQLEQDAQQNKYIFGMYNHNLNTRQGEFHILVLKDEKILNKIIDKSKPDEYNKLNITVLHSLVIDKILTGRDKNKVYLDNIGYTHSEEEAINLVDEGKYKIAFFLNPTRIEELKNIALAGGLMPQKSTYFYPKLETGLVINKL